MGRFSNNGLCDRQYWRESLPILGYVMRDDGGKVYRCDGESDAMRPVCPADCPVCYNLVQERVREHRLKLRQLKELIINIGKNPQAINDTDFRLKMAAVSRTVDSLLADARRTGGQWGARRVVAAFALSIERFQMVARSKCRGTARYRYRIFKVSKCRLTTGWLNFNIISICRR